MQSKINSARFLRVIGIGPTPSSLGKTIEKPRDPQGAWRGQDMEAKE